MYTLIEPCCGSAALSVHLIGGTRPILPYQGSKWRFRHGLTQLLSELGFDGRPHAVQLSDVGPWGGTMGGVLTTGDRAIIVGHLEELGARDPREVFDSLHQGAVAVDALRYAAEFLFLQRLSFSGKAVANRDGRWMSPGFNTSSAYGLDATERFGKVNPMIPGLIRVLRRYDVTLSSDVHVTCTQGPASAPDNAVAGPTLVYLDPPYVRSTRYPNGDLAREGVVRLALAWTAAGAQVVISEGEAVSELVDQGWTARVLDSGRQDSSPFRGKQQEWVTFSGR